MNEIKSEIAPQPSCETCAGRAHDAGEHVDASYFRHSRRRILIKS